MCHDPSSRPPVPPADAVHDRQDLGRSAELHLTSADGAPLLAYEAVPSGRPWARVVVLPDVRGLHPYYRALADRLAETGLHAVAIDYFGRTAADLPRNDDFDFRAHTPHVTPEHVTADVTTAIQHTAGGEEGQDAVLTLGFCFGGGHSWRLAAEGLGLAGCIGFYGRPMVMQEAVQNSDRVPDPVLMLIAGADAATPVPDSLAGADLLRSKGGEVETHVFDGAPHSFFDRGFAEHAQACEEAWRLLLAFAERHAGVRQG
jgi:carboxymethylenebutenolidase